MKSIILAAGYATRLYPLTENFPKPLLDVGGKPILDWLIDDLGDAIDEYVVVTNHKFADIFRDWAGKRANRITVIDDGTTTNETRLGAVKDIRLAADELAEQTADTTKDEPILVMAGDNMLDFSLRGFVDYQQSIGTSCVMCHEEKELTALQKTAVITIDTDNTITSYEEKPKQPKGTLAVPPFYIYCSQDIARIQEALDDGCGYDAPGSFAAWLSTKTPLHAYVMPGKRYDIGDVASYERVKGVFTP